MYVRPRPAPALDDKSVDIVSIATPNHWHSLAAIWAMQAGKDVYVEKPVSHNVSEGRRMVQVARKIQPDLPGRHAAPLGQAPTAAAVRYMAEGKLGKIKLARSVTYRPRKPIGPPGQGTDPAGRGLQPLGRPGADGPGDPQELPLRLALVLGLGNGEIGNNSIHPVDLVRWGLGLTGLGRGRDELRRPVLFNDAGQTRQHAGRDPRLRRGHRGPGSPQPRYHQRLAPPAGMFQGTEGYLVLGSGSATVFDPHGKKVRAFAGAMEDHFANFLKAVRSRKPEDLHAEIFGGHLSAGLCHLGNISYRLGHPASPVEISGQLESRKVRDNVIDTFQRTVKHLVANGVDLEKSPITLGPWPDFDPAKETFLNHAEANRLLLRDYRRPFVVPKESEI